MKLADVLKDAFIRAGVELPKKLKYKKKATKHKWNKTDQTINCPIKTKTKKQSELKGAAATEIKNRILVEPDARFTWQPSESKKNLLLDLPLTGKKVALAQKPGEKILCIGLDFGTSTLKAVITDNERNISYAIPFRNELNVNRYLLPCRVSLDRNKYGLTTGGIVYQDLKLSLIENPENINQQTHVIAFLALALQKIRAWLLSEHGKTYSETLVWDLAVGLPIAHTGNNVLTRVYKKLSIAAWIASTNDILTTESIANALERAKELEAGKKIEFENEDIEVSVKPEIAAQIYGFVSSGAYDPSGKNFYLMVDVGAGTLDASVFRIEKAKGKIKTNLVLFKTTVEPHGVMNLHKKRMDWLESALQENHPERKDLLESVAESKSIIDVLKPLPNIIDQYFKGVECKPFDEGVDNNFYKKVKTQVSGHTYYQTWKERLLGSNDMKMPMFLCGGGSRWCFYSKLQEQMKEYPGDTYLGVSPRQLQQPQKLIASGLNEKDYDRLSVAFGLSKLKLGDVTMDVEPLPLEVKKSDYADKYVDSSQV